MTLRPVVLRGAGVSECAPRVLEDAFPGRWNPRRTMWPDAGTLVHAIGRALIAAELWQPGSGTAVDGGQVVGVDLHAVGVAHRFATDLAREPSSARATDFLFALPSSCAAIAGVAFGLERYQATSSSGALAGFHAVGHACDLIATGRVERVVAAALTAIDAESAKLCAALGMIERDRGPFALAVAWCLEAGHADDMHTATTIDGCEIEPNSGDSAAFATGEPPLLAIPADHLSADVPAEYRHLAAPSLLRATRALAATVHGAPCRLSHLDPRSGAIARMSLRVGRLPIGRPERSTW